MAGSCYKGRVNESKEKQTWRLINRDGSMNVVRAGRSGNLRDLYHVFLTLKWWQFLSTLAVVYVGLNVIFALVYFLLGPDAVVRGDLSLLQGDAYRLIQCFYFSVETFATVGYGSLIPNGNAANLVMTAECFIGVLYVALVTGVFFARFSRPTARVVFSRVAVIRPEDGVPSLMFRLANLRLNQIVDAQISVNLARAEKTKEGETYRTFQELKLERQRSPMFVLSWTIVHPIDQHSPLYGMSRQDFLDQEAEIIVVLTGWDETFSSTIHARYSYIADDIRWDHRFLDIICRTEDQKAGIDLDLLHDVEPVQSST